MLAVEQEQADVAKLLLEAGVDSDTANNKVLSLLESTLATWMQLLPCAYASAHLNALKILSLLCVITS